MQKNLVFMSEKMITGISVRTNNNDEFEPATAKIGKLVNEYWANNISAQIANRKNPGVTFVVYTDYASNELGEYTCCIGEEVTAFENISDDLQNLTIPGGSYQVFTTEKGAIPQVVVEAWQTIWPLSSHELGGKRAYQADFEVYDQRAADPTSAIIDIHIGITTT